MDNFLIVCYIISIFVVAFILTEIEESKGKKVKSKTKFGLAFKSFWQTIKNHRVMRAICYFILSTQFLFLFKQFDTGTLFNLSVVFVEVGIFFTMINFILVFVKTFLQIFDEAKDLMLNSTEGYLYDDD